VRGPVLGKLYAELKRCGDLSCTGWPFIEHRNVPVLTINPRDSRPARQQVTATLTETIQSGSANEYEADVTAIDHNVERGHQVAVTIDQPRLPE
jgi:hypothetical protein